MSDLLAPPLLLAHARSIPRAGAILDLSAGDGDAALYLAQRGHAVDVVEPDAARREVLAGRADELDLRVAVIDGHPWSVVPPRGRYAAVLGVGLLPTLSEAEVEALLGRLPSWVLDGGVVILSSGDDGDASSTWQPDHIRAHFWGFEVLSGDAGPEDPVRDLVLRRTA